MAVMALMHSAAPHSTEDSTVPTSESGNYHTGGHVTLPRGKYTTASSVSNTSLRASQASS